jgi:hypothetical protein
MLPHIQKQNIVVIEAVKVIAERRSKRFHYCILYQILLSSWIAINHTNATLFQFRTEARPSSKADKRELHESLSLNAQRLRQNHLLLSKLRIGAMKENHKLDRCL